MVVQLGTIKMLEHAVLMGGVKSIVYAGSGCTIFWALAPLLLEEDFVSLHLSTPYQISQIS